MDKKEALKRIEKLKKEIDKHRYLYHVLDKPEISDAALDSLKHELFLLEQEFPEFITKDSPTQRVGGEVLQKFSKVTHSLRMISLEDKFSIEEMKDWEKRIKKLAPNSKIDYFCELKIDGLAISLKYNEGLLQYAATRGDGKVGEDVTGNVKTIESIPLRIDTKAKVIEVRGEVYISKKNFEKLNEQRSSQGENLYANPRNLAAGSIRQLDPKLAASRNLDFIAYELVTDLGWKTHEEKHKILSELGFKTCKDNKYCRDLNEVYEFYKDLQNKREKLKFEIDGVVVIINNEALHDKLGIVGKAPRWSVAFKFPAKQTTTIVEDIQVQIGRTGALTPVAHLKPVMVAGSVVSRATLHNMNEIKKLGVKIGDSVIIQKAGDVIPDIVKVLSGLRTGKEKEFTMPKTCPMCGSKVQKRANEAAYYCPNKSCFAKEKEKITHFASKKAFGIDGLGIKIVEQLMNEGLVSNFSDIFRLKTGDLEGLERFAQKSASNLVHSIQNRLNIILPKFLFALGIRHVGEESAILLANFIQEIYSINNPMDLIKAFKKIAQADLMKIPGFGDKISSSVFQYFQDQNNLAELAKLHESGIVFHKTEKLKIKEGITGKKFLMTGSFKKYKRDEAYDLLRSYGAEIISNVSKNLDFLLVGEDPGSKLAKAKKMGIHILTENEFIKLINK